MANIHREAEPEAEAQAQSQSQSQSSVTAVPLAKTASAASHSSHSSIDTTTSSTSTSATSSTTSSPLSATASSRPWPAQATTAAGAGGPSAAQATPASSSSARNRRQQPHRQQQQHERRSSYASTASSSPPSASSSSTSSWSAIQTNSLRSMLISLFRFFLFPNGILAIALYAFYIIPVIIFRRLFNLPHTSPASWDLSTDILIHLVRYSMRGRDWRRLRKLMGLVDAIGRVMVWAMGFRIERVKRLAGSSSEYVVEGAWIVGKGDIVPNVRSQEWKDRLVVLWVHGGGYTTGSSLSFASANCEIMRHYQELAEEIRAPPMLYFAMEYPKAPESKYPKQLETMLSTYIWLVQQVGVTNIMIAGDSAGANLALNLHRSLLMLNKKTSIVLPRALVLLSPWMDVSRSHTPPHIQEHFAATSDYLSTKLLDAFAANITPSGLNRRDPSISPIFDLEPLDMPHDGIFVVYSGSEVLTPDIDDWVESMRRQNNQNRNLLKVLRVDDMPHDFAVALHAFPTPIRKASVYALREVARFAFGSFLRGTYDM